MANYVLRYPIDVVPMTFAEWVEYKGCKPLQGDSNIQGYKVVWHCGKESFMKKHVLESNYKEVI